MIDRNGVYNTGGAFGNQYNNTDEELFSDFQRPRDHNGFKVGKKKGINSSGGDNGGGGGVKVKTMQVKISGGSVSANGDYNRIPSGTYTISGDGGFCELSGNRIKFLEAGLYLFSYREMGMETSAGNEGRHTSMLVHGANYSEQGELFDYAIIYDTSCNIVIGRASPLSTTGYAAIEKGEEVVYCVTTAKRYAGSAASALVSSLNAYIDIIKIG